MLNYKGNSLNLCNKFQLETKLKDITLLCEARILNKRVA